MILVLSISIWGFLFPLSSLLALTDRVCARRGFERNPRMVWSDVGSTSSPIGFPEVGVPSLRGGEKVETAEKFFPSESTS